MRIKRKELMVKKEFPVKWEEAMDIDVLRYHTTICWIAVVFNLLFSVVDYFNNAETWFQFLLIRIGISIVTAFLLFMRSRWNMIAELLAFIPFMLISIQNAYMWSIMDAGEMQKHTFSYIALIIGAGMMLLWRKHWSIKALYLSLPINILFFYLFSELTAEEILVNGGALTFLVMVIFIFLVDVRYRLTKSSIISRLQLEHSNKQLARQKSLVEEKNQEILDSITYAKRIQSAVLPSRKSFEEFLGNPVVFFKPKDIVAGDFYWIHNSKQYTYFAAADCTGHGVPGAMVSMVCTAALNRATVELKLTETSEILDLVRKIVVSTLSKGDDEIQDGMDIALCRLDNKTLEVQFTGAKSPLYHFRHLKEGEVPSEKGVFNKTHILNEYKGDRQPVGRYVDEKPFTSTTIQTQKGEYIFIFSDGFADQFGGANSRKFKYGPFKKLLSEVMKEPNSKQQQILNEVFEKWRNDLEQVDDVCVIGVMI